jgi:hypothetical protein
MMQFSVLEMLEPLESSKSREIKTDDVFLMLEDVMRLECQMWMMGGLALLADVAAHDILVNKGGHARPPIELTDEFKGTIPFRMSD